MQLPVHSRLAGVMDNDQLFSNGGASSGRDSNGNGSLPKGRMLQKQLTQAVSEQKSQGGSSRFSSISWSRHSSAHSSSAPHISEEELRTQLRLIFDKFDAGGSGAISTAEMGAIVQELELDVSIKQIKAIMIGSDRNGSGEMEFDEFFDVLAKEMRSGGGVMTRIVNSALKCGPTFLSSRLPYRLASALNRLPGQQPKITDMRQVALIAMREKRLSNRLQELGWRSPCEYKIRQVMAWSFNVSTLLAFLFVSLIYGLKFGNQQTKNMCLSWLMSYGITFAIVEPFQVLLLACAPCLFNEETRVGRWCGRCRFVYNELCAP
uniref:EF-hand domain-containing protein n=1 Tax=Haptolina brevifila TaxID=156173 RepID=A0A7S2IYL5_9EUKA|mmetsp:Transcript_73128/g.145438  ORF Transcript_73128/g.145438 Transcript_73128/m.145438 type:complete len:320 (+) Transcript_73128:492-1451(+)